MGRSENSYGCRVQRHPFFLEKRKIRMIFTIHTAQDHQLAFG